MLIQKLSESSNLKPALRTFYRKPSEGCEMLRSSLNSLDLKTKEPGLKDTSFCWWSESLPKFPVY